jgi:hypothetical protein
MAKSAILKKRKKHTILFRPINRIGVKIGVRASIFEFQVICLDGGDVPHIFDVQAVGSGCCPLLHPDQVI